MQIVRAFITTLIAFMSGCTETETKVSQGYLEILSDPYVPREGDTFIDPQKGELTIFSNGEWIVVQTHPPSGPIFNWTIVY